MGLCREMGKEDREGERGGRDGEEIGKERQRERASFCRKVTAFGGRALESEWLDLNSLLLYLLAV
jgi:hypothetical protein